MMSELQTQPSATPSLGQPSASASNLPTEPPPHSLLHAYVNLPVVQSLYRDAVGRFLTLNKQIREQRRQLSKFRTRCNKNSDTIDLPRSLAIVIDTRVQLPATKDPSFFAVERKALKAIEQTATKAVYDQIVAARTRHITELTKQVDSSAFISEEVQRHRIDIDKFAVEAFPSGIESHHAHAAAPASQAGAAAASASPAASFTNDAQVHFEQYLRARVVSEAARIAMEDKEAKELAAQGHADNEDAREQVMRGAHNSETISQIAHRAAAAVYKSQIKDLAPPARRAVPASQRPPNASAKFTLHPAFFTKPPVSKKRKHAHSDVAAAAHDADDDRMDIDDDSDPSIANAASSSRRLSSFSSGGDPRNTSHTINMKRRKTDYGRNGEGRDTSRSDQ